jgi:hypothetical protein
VALIVPEEECTGEEGRERRSREAVATEVVEEDLQY